MTQQYIVVYGATLEALEAGVAEKLASGYSLVGGPAVTADGGYIQAVIGG